MTVDEPESGPKKSADEWLSDEHDGLRLGLSRFLDLDGGLREARTHAGGHGDVVRRLSGVLDVEGGLAAILRPGTAGASAEESGLSRSAEESDVAAAVRAVSVARRLAMRKHPAVTACVVGDLLVRAVEIAGDLDRDRHRLVLAGDDWLDRCRERASVLAADLDRVRADLDVPRGSARDLARYLATSRTLGRTRNLVTRDAVLARTLAKDIAGALVRILVEALELGVVSVLELARARGLTIDIAGGLSPNLALVRASALAADLAYEAGAQLTLSATEGTEGLAAALLDGILDDFTHADLTDVDLAEADLAGIHWSEHGTRWPPGTDVEDLRRKSRETAPNSGVYVLGQPPAGSSRTGDGIRV